MKRHALMVIPVAVVALLAAGLWPPPGAAAQPQHTLVIVPSSGPCDATVEVKGSGFAEFAGEAATNLYLIQPGTTDVSMGFLVPAHPDWDGAFSQWAGLHEHGCEAAALDSQAGQPAGYLAIAAAPGGPPVQPGERIPNIIAVAHYTYTTPPPPVMVISPASGPCDATVEVTGQDFPPNAEIYLAVGGTDGRSPVGRLGSAMSDGQGRFSSTVLLGYWGCDMAAVTKERINGDQLWLLGYVQEPASYGPVAGTVARAPYIFTTTESTLPVAVLTLSPSSGPCDATVQATGTLFEPGSNVALEVARPRSEGVMGTLGQVRADAEGGFVATLALGTLGCEAAALHAPLGKPNEFRVCGDAYQASRCATYTATTTVPAGAASPSALPSAGQGGTSPRIDIRSLAMVAALLGVVLLVGGLVAARRRSS